MLRNITYTAPFIGRHFVIKHPLGWVKLSYSSEVLSGSGEIYSVDLAIFSSFLTPYQVVRFLNLKLCVM
jgi:hypothetical protein